MLGHLGGGRGEEPLEVAHRERADDRIGVGEVAVDRRARHAGPAGDEGGGERAVAALVDESGRGVEDEVDALRAAALHRLSAQAVGFVRHALILSVRRDAACGVPRLGGTAGAAIHASCSKRYEL